MRNLLLVSIILVAFTTSGISQDTGKDPYAIFGHKSTTKYETKVSELLRITNRDTTAGIKTLAFDMEHQLVLLLDNKDSLLQKIPIEANILLRWLSIDPKASKYPHLSPYNFVGNNPLNAIDPDGQDIVVLNNPNGASGYGHMAVLIGSDKTGWTFVSKEGRDKTPWYSNEVTGGPALTPKIQTFSSLEAFTEAQKNDADLGAYTQNLRFATDEKQDQTALTTTEKAAKSWYNVVFSNCADAVSDGLSKVGIDPGNVTEDGGLYPVTTTPAKPNDRFKAIKVNNADIIIPTFPVVQPVTTGTTTTTTTTQNNSNNNNTSTKPKKAGNGN